MPFAAFFVAFLLLLCIPRRSRKLALCLLLGALAGLCAVHTTSARLERTRANYAGRTVLLTAEVERADSTYFSDTLVRVALMATHTKEQIDSAVEKLVKAFKALDLL